MNINKQPSHLPPSENFGIGVTYGSDGERISTPEAQHAVPRIARRAGETAVHQVIQPGFLDAIVAGVQARAEAPGEKAAEDYVLLSDLEASQPIAGNSYAGPASRQMALERAEIEHIQRAAAEAVMSVDQWKATRH